MTTPSAETVYQTFSESLCAESELDLYATFAELDSIERRVSALAAIIDTVGEKVDSIAHHRALVVLACLLEAPQTRDTLTNADLDLLRGRAVSRQIVSHLARSPKHEAALAVLDPSLLRAEAKRALRQTIRTATVNELSPRHLWSRPTPHNVIVTHLPVRLDLGMGGLSDLPPYSHERRGSAVSVPILVNNQRAITVSAKATPDRLIRLRSLDLDEMDSYVSLSDLHRAKTTDLSLLAEVIRFLLEVTLGATSLGVLFDRLNGGLELSTKSSISHGSGLGVSTILATGALQVTHTLLGITLSESALVQAAVYLEATTGIGGGWEDTAALRPGFRLLESDPKRPSAPRSTLLCVSDTAVDNLKRSLILVQTGISKSSAGFFDPIIEDYCLRRTSTMKAIGAIDSANHRIAEYLASDRGLLENLGTQMNYQWDAWKTLTKGVCTTNLIDELRRQVAPFVYGQRVNGAGPGGCAMLLTTGPSLDNLRKVLKEVLGPSCNELAWRPLIEDHETGDSY